MGVDKDKNPTQQSWVNSLGKSDKWLEKYLREAKTNNEQYLPNNGNSNNGATTRKLPRYNLFNSNVNVLKSTMFARLPEPTVSRQFADINDQVSRVASLVLERVITYDIHSTTRTRAAIERCLTDYLVGGSGWLYARFDADVENPTIISDQETDDLAEGSIVVRNQKTGIEYINYKDVRWSTARTWEEVTWWARRVYMCEEDFTQRFGADKAKKVDFTTEPDDLDASFRDGIIDKATEFSEGKVAVWEIWDKESRKVFYVVKFLDEILDVIDDPYGLPEFFPVMPFFANCTNDACIPVSDFNLLQFQYRDHNELVQRLARLNKSVRLAGVYSAEYSEVKQLMETPGDSVMIPLASFQNFSEKGGLKSAMDFIPLKEFAEVIQLLSASKAELEQQIDAITGISDIIRGGDGQQYESAAASKLKSQYANVRLGNKSDALAHLITYIVKCMAHFVCKFYSDDEIIQRIGILNQNDTQLVPQAIQLLRNELVRVMRVEVSTDSLKAPDFARDTAEKTGLLQQLAAFLPQAVQAAQAMPQLAPAMFSVFGWALAGTRGAREIEGEIESALQAFINDQAQKAANPEPPKPDPAMAQVQAQLQMAQQTQETERMKLQMQHELNQKKLAQEMEIERMKLANEAQRLEIERGKLELDGQRLMLAQDELETQAVIEAQKLKQNEEQFLLKLAAGDNPVPESVSQPDVNGLDTFNPLGSVSPVNVHIQADHTPDGL